mgnify:CR=1 FL=1
MERDEYIYYRFMKDATEDDYISLDESGLILVLEDKLGLSDDQMDGVMELIQEGKKPDLTEEQLEEIENDMSNHIYEKKVYRDVLEEALLDEDIRKDEFSLMKTLSGVMNITPDEKNEIFQEVKSDLEGEKKEEDVPKLLIRAKHLLGMDD